MITSSQNQPTAARRDDLSKLRNPAVLLEEERLKDVLSVDDFNMFHERHRIFPAIFEDRRHKHIIDVSAGIGAAANRINNQYNAELLCNEICPKCLRSLKQLGLKTTSFDLDDAALSYPLENKSYDAIISLATIEHLYNIDNFFKEANRILEDNGYLYLSVPNYNGLNYLIPLLFKGKTFHDPLNPREKYEFYGHLRYFTHVSLIEFVTNHGFTAEAVYLGKPEMGTRYLRFKAKHPLGAAIYKALILSMFHLLPARWSPEPVVCFKKSTHPKLVLKPGKKIL